MMKPNAQYGSRFAWIEGYTKGKRVLDVGSFGTATHGTELTLWERIRRSADDFMSIDKNPRAAIAGVTIADACTVKLHRRFETIVMGEVIEHVGNAAMLLENMREHLDSSGNIVLTTPNCPSWYDAIGCLTWRPRAISSEHVAKYCRETMHNLAKSCGLEQVLAVPFASDREHATLLARLATFLWPRMAPCYGYVLKRQE
jgi:cyclopropane fatty-acyl-phospholipid synthase-like methyltransferase